MEKKKRGVRDVASFGWQSFLISQTWPKGLLPRWQLVLELKGVTSKQEHVIGRQKNKKKNKPKDIRLKWVSFHLEVGISTCGGNGRFRGFPPPCALKDGEFKDIIRMKWESWTCETIKGGKTESQMHWRMFAHPLCLGSPIMQEGNRSFACLPVVLADVSLRLRTKFNGVPFSSSPLWTGNPNCFKPTGRWENLHQTKMALWLYVACARARLHSPVQLRAQTAALQSLHRPSNSSCALSWIA